MWERRAVLPARLRLLGHQSVQAGHNHRIKTAKTAIEGLLNAFDTSPDILQAIVKTSVRCGVSCVALLLYPG